ncbi:hypothetical protein O53_2714 [Microcystis aeruginosa TAIHU98]|uniref:Uncharacterized protein n=1 Tax=Microcystis aeruginosa TAIHU98 TaxID=1134457 RepID=L7E5H7_MICAE|nr:hypothetical protein O53_2714 [Microcystis aeruginosa TAIHU98]
MLFYPEKNPPVLGGIFISDRRSCRVRSLMQLLPLHRSIFGERTMHID